MTRPKIQLDSRKDFAAQNAQEGLINVMELSLLTGIEDSQLNKFAKNGELAHYGEYHGKRFFNFQEIIAWLVGSAKETEAKKSIRLGVERELGSSDCPYSIEQAPATERTELQTKIYWKVPSA